jgi:pimeloyl-ACP methyl ester carboxylesterase
MLAEPRQTRIDGTTIAWTELGSGPPLVLLHGLGDSHRTWRRVAPKLAKHFRVLMADLPGHGLSDRPDAPYTLDWYARTMHLWLDALGVETTAAVGHSYGGGVAQWMVLERPTRIDRLALVAPGGLGREVMLGLRLASVPWLGSRLTQPLMEPGTHVLMRLGIGAHARIEREEIALSASMNGRPGTGRAFQRTVAGVMGLLGQRVQTWDRIHEVAALPQLALFWGDRDRIVPIVHGDRAQRRIGGAGFHRYPGIGHFVQLEASEKFGDDLLGFLRATGAATPQLLDETLLARWRAAQSALLRPV